MMYEYDKGDYDDEILWMRFVLSFVPIFGEKLSSLVFHESKEIQIKYCILTE